MKQVHKVEILVMSDVIIQRLNMISEIRSEEIKGEKFTSVLSVSVSTITVLMLVIKIQQFHGQ